MSTPRAGARGALVFAFVFSIVLAWACPGRAEGAGDRIATAQGLYDAAAELMVAGKFGEACPKLEESQRLDPAMGTQFYLATCYESTGRPTKAWSLFLEVASAARAYGNAQREATARLRAAVLEPKLPRVTVVVADESAKLRGLRVARDEAVLKPVVWGSPVPVDLGPHTVRVTAEGKAPWTATVTVRELGQRIEVQVPALVDRSAAVGPVTAAARQDSSEGDGAPEADVPPQPAAGAGLGVQRVAGIVAGGAGLAGLVAGGALGLAARSAWNDASAACPAHAACSPSAHAESVRSVGLATGSTVAFAAGGAAIAGGVVAWLTAPARKASATLRFTPVAAGAAGAFLTGDL
jgi:hypothetical protein